METFINFLIALGWIWCGSGLVGIGVLVVGFVTARPGYEDETGFHYGEQPKP